MWLHHKIDPDWIDWAYFTLGSEKLTDLLGDISFKLYEWGSK